MSARWLILAILLLGGRGRAQCRFSLEGLPARATFGERFELAVERGWPVGHAVLPFDPAPFGELSVRLLSAGVRRRGDMLFERRRYEAVPLRSGELAIGPFQVRSRDPAGREHVESFDLAPLPVDSVLPDPPGPIEWPGDVRLPPASNPLLVPMLAALVLFGLVGFGLRWRRTRTTVAPTSSVDPAIEAGLRALDELRALRIPSGGAESPEGYYVAVADVVRRYLSVRFGLRAGVRTSSELLAAVDRAKIPLGECLAACDLVKFAAARPDSEAHERVRRWAEAFVTGSAPPVEDGA